MANRSGTSRSPRSEPGLDDVPILHIDLDAFFASVEVNDDPSLRGRPVAVGGAGARGVIASASYEARRFGVHSAMASVVALRQCPQLVILPGRFDRYEEYSSRFHRIVEDLTPQFEPLGLDEVFADLRSLHRLDVRPVEAAARLRRRVREELDLDAGVGLGSSKLFAKLASKRAKPRVLDGELVAGPGVYWVAPGEQSQWLAELPVRALWGVGPATASRLARLGITRVRELAEVPEETLVHHFGPSLAHTLAEMAQGRDDRPVVANRAAKSIGHEETFAISVLEPESLGAIARRHAAVVARALRSSGQVAHTISIVMRFDDLSSLSRAQTLNFGVDDDAAVGTIAAALVESVALRGPVRLLGVSASSLGPRERNQVQLAFDLPADAAGGAESVSRSQQADRGALNDAVDDLRRRFGRSAIGQGADFLGGRLDVAVQRGSHAFGPEGGESASQRP
jgi:DNA polymerase-4